MPGGEGEVRGHDPLSDASSQVAVAEVILDDAGGGQCRGWAWAHRQRVADAAAACVW